MVKLLVFAILLASASSSSLLEELFSAENTCYNGCHVNYAASTTHLDACTQGCDFKLHNEDCANQCKTKYSNEAEADSCQVGCTLGHAHSDVIPDKPFLAIDPVPDIEPKETEATTTTAAAVPETESEPERPRSIIIIRLRQRPSLEMPPAPPMESVFPNDPIQMFNDIVRRFQERAKIFEDSIRASIDEQSKDMPKSDASQPIPDIVQAIPFIRISTNVREDSSSESSEESSNGRSMMNEMRHVMHHPREQQQFIRDHVERVDGQMKETWSNIRNQWNEFVRNQPKMPIWFFIGLLLSSSALLWYMLVSLCRQSPSYNPLTVRAQELVFYPYEYDGYEKEKIQPDGQLYDATEPLPIKVKLSNI